MKNKLLTKILIAIFCLFIGLIGILYAVLPKSEYSQSEKRYLQQMPKISIQEIKTGRFSENFEKFLADQTPLRKFFVGTNAYFELLKGNNGSNEIYLGKDGWLIEKPFNNTNKLLTNISRINDFSSSISLPVSVVIVPSKGYIYSDKLPKNTLQYLDENYNLQIKNSLDKSITYIDIIDNLKSQSKTVDIFYKTDHHWTSEGAFIAYEQICKNKNFAIPNKSNYNIETKKDFYGTSYSKSGYFFNKPDSLNIYKNKYINNVSVKIYEGSKINEYSTMFFENRLTEDDKYVVYLDGNHSRVDIENYDINGNTLLLIKDSYAHCLAPFLSENYSKIIMVDLRYYKENLNDIIETEKIDEVLFIYSIENLATSNDIVF